MRGIPTGKLSYLEFMAPGMLAQSVLFIAIFYGIAVIWERDLGIVHKLLVSPAVALAPGAGQGASPPISAALLQAVIIYVLALVHAACSCGWQPRRLPACWSRSCSARRSSPPSR